MSRRPRHLKQSTWRRRRTILGSYPAPAGARGPSIALPLPETEARRRLAEQTRAMKASAAEGIEHSAGI